MRKGTNKIINNYGIMQMKHTINMGFFTGLSALVCLTLFGCQQGHKPAGGTSTAKAPASQPGPKGRPERSEVVARVGNTTITVGQLEDAINEQDPFVRRRYTSLEQRKKLLKHLVQFEVLAAEARRRKLENDPEVVRRVKRAMINGMMAKMQRELVKLEDITDADIKARYQQEIALYRQPAMVRVSQIVLKERAQAERMMGLLKKKPKDTRYFAELVGLHSEDMASRSQQGDLDFFAKDDKKIPTEVRQAAFGIEQMWGLAGPVKVGDRYVVLMKTGEREPFDRTLDQERTSIRNKLYNERRRKALDDFVANLEAKAKVEVVDKNLSKVKLKKGGKLIMPAHPHP